jgi:hypothetical protein
MKVLSKIGAWVAAQPIRGGHVRLLRGLMATATVACLSGAALTAVGTPATAAVPTTVDVGRTIVDPVTWQWKGSGSYSNGNGTYKRFCVQLRQDRPGFDTTLSSQCVDTPAGSQGEFSAPPVACFNKLGWAVYTRAIALNSAGEIVRNGEAQSNRIPHTC